VALVRTLLAGQHPDLATTPITAAESGWDNAMFRLGRDLAVRLPRREMGVALLAKEQRWLPQIAERLAVLTTRVPSPIRVGRPSQEFPWPWSVVPWIEGEAADLAPPSDRAYRQLGQFLRTLHVPGPSSGPHNPYRGVPLRERAHAIDARIDRVRAEVNLVTAPVLGAWQAAVHAEPTAERVWVHGDLHPRNLLVSNGELAGVVDWGDMTIGDPATDLAGIWMCCPNQRARAAAWQEYGAVDDATRIRARGWACFFGIVLTDIGLSDDARHGAVGRHTLRALHEDLTS
jgi:aminoglycoside phosphotransferase (APT) family kinase protein